MIKNLIIPMAGLGKRFKNENFSTIKPLLLLIKIVFLKGPIKDLPDSKI